MQKLLSTLLFTLVLAGTPFATRAEAKSLPGVALLQQGDRTVASLLATCETQTMAAQNWCAAYLLGTADTLSVMGTSGFNGGLCRANYNISQLPPLFVAWAHKHPDMRNFESLAGVTLAFHQAWPCE